MLPFGVIKIENYRTLHQKPRERARLRSVPGFQANSVGLYNDGNLSRNSKLIPPKSRSSGKQTIKPRLPGARTTSFATTNPYDSSSKTVSHRARNRRAR